LRFVEIDEDESQLLVNVSLIYTRISLLLAAVDRGSRAVNDSRRINHAAKTLEYVLAHKAESRDTELHAVVEASAAITSRDDDVLTLGCRPAKTECSSCGPGVAGTSKLIVTYSR
jgi:hypothetical protein